MPTCAKTCEATLVLVTSCADCPFVVEPPPEEPDEAWLCSAAEDARALHAEGEAFHPWHSKPPAWCPLRASDRLATLRLVDPGRGLARLPADTVASAIAYETGLGAAALTRDLVGSTELETYVQSDIRILQEGLEFLRLGDLSAYQPIRIPSGIRPCDAPQEEAPQDRATQAVPTSMSMPMSKSHFHALTRIQIAHCLRDGSRVSAQLSRVYDAMPASAKEDPVAWETMGQLRRAGLAKPVWGSVSSGWALTSAGLTAWQEHAKQPTRTQETP